MIDVASLGHVAIRVRDMQRSLEFYTRRLGFAEMMRLNYADGSLFLVYLRITDSQFLELFPDGVGERAPGREATAVNHFCITVEDIDRTVAQLAAAGIPLSRELKVGADDNRQCWIDDPDGNRIEIMEMRADSMQVGAVERVHSGAPPIVRTTAVARP
jgi:lactoylglutathione lyase